METLVEKWADLIDTDKAPAVQQREQMAQLLENQEAYLQETVNVQADMAQYTPILVPAVRRIFPNLIANEICGVQALKLPSGYAYALRYAYAGNTTEAGAGKFGGVSNANKDLGNSQFNAGLGADTYAQPSFGSFAILATSCGIVAENNHVFLSLGVSDKILVISS